MTQHTTTGAPVNDALRSHRITFIGCVRSELLKLLSVRSILVTLLACIPVSLLLTLISAPSKAEVMGSDATTNLELLARSYTFTVIFGILLTVIVAVLCISNEYATGQIGSTLTVVPRRLRVIGAKITALAVVVWVIGFAGVALSALLATAMLSGNGPLPEPAALATEILVTAASAATAMTLISLISLCIGGILRSTAFSIAAAFVLILVLPGLVALSPWEWARGLAPFLPINAATALYDPTSIPNPLDPLQALPLLIGFVIVGTTLWALSWTRRDP
ncbi:hypothetical protein GCM10023063_24820 [Arthrobacter methylotrophus]|uniref:ABC transporter permease n=1 Tax=Arthrobacter methylotrophus TaxID=121291 RepID=A0ABV5UPL0_9MICC